MVAFTHSHGSPWMHVSVVADDLGIPEQTIRTWIRREQVMASTDRYGRIVVWWVDCHERQQAATLRNERGVLVNTPGVQATPKPLTG